MASIESGVTIQAPVSKVYEKVTAFEGGEVQEWRESVETVNITAGNPLRAGSMIAMTKRFRGSSIFLNVDVVDLQRNKKVSLQGMHGRFRYRRDIEFTPISRETRVSDRIQLDLGWFWFWYAPLVSASLRRQTQREWQQLKQLLESKP